MAKTKITYNNSEIADASNPVEITMKTAGKKMLTDTVVLGESELPTGGQVGDILTKTENSCEWAANSALPASGYAADDEGKVPTVNSSGELELTTPSAGTNVVANPELAGTEAALTGIQIDSTKYKISQGTNVVANPSLSGSTPSLTGLQVGDSKYKVSYVRANPELEGTESDLTGLRVENTNYKISSGGNTSTTTFAEIVQRLSHGYWEVDNFSHFILYINSIAFCQYLVEPALDEFYSDHEDGYVVDISIIRNPADKGFQISTAATFSPGGGENWYYSCGNHDELYQISVYAYEPSTFDWEYAEDLITPLSLMIVLEGTKGDPSSSSIPGTVETYRYIRTFSLAQLLPYLSIEF